MADSQGALSGFGPFKRDRPGPLYRQIESWLGGALSSVEPSAALPSERRLADEAGVSRGTMSRALGELVRAGLLVRRRGSGTFFVSHRAHFEPSRPSPPRFRNDGVKDEDVDWMPVESGVQTASPEEIFVLGLAIDARVSRAMYLGIYEGTPVAIQRTSVPNDVLHNGAAVPSSLRAQLEWKGILPSRAVERIQAVNLSTEDAALLRVAVGAVTLSIHRVAYLPSGRAVEFTRSLYRQDAYRLVTELRAPKS